MVGGSLGLSCGMKFGDGEIFGMWDSQSSSVTRDNHGSLNNMWEAGVLDRSALWASDLLSIFRLR